MNGFNYILITTNTIFMNQYKIDRIIMAVKYRLGNDYLAG